MGFGSRSWRFGVGWLRDVRGRCRCPAAARRRDCSYTSHGLAQRTSRRGSAGARRSSCSVHDEGGRLRCGVVDEARRRLAAASLLDVATVARAQGGAEDEACRGRGVATTGARGQGSARRGVRAAGQVGDADTERLRARGAGRRRGSGKSSRLCVVTRPRRGWCRSLGPWRRTSTSGSRVRLGGARRRRGPGRG